VNPGPCSEPLAGSESALPPGTEVAVSIVGMMLIERGKNAAARGKRDLLGRIAFSRVLVLGFEIDSNAVFDK
jgi:hypothetical protein